jgi:hypothetical protein
MVLNRQKILVDQSLGFYQIRLPDREFDRNPKTDQQGLFVYLNTGDGFDNGSHRH